MDITVRAAGPEDRDFLAQMLVEAAFWWGEEHATSVEEAVRPPELAQYLDGWPKPGDVGVVAAPSAAPDQPIGASWARLFEARAPAYGFVDAATPELVLGVATSWRGQGVGLKLLEGLSTAARDAGHPALSLSVDAQNPALRVYQRAGFREVAASLDGGSLVMVKPL